MKYFFIMILLFGFQYANAFEVECICEEPCKAVTFEISKTNLGTLMTVDTFVNQVSGMATVSDSKVDDEITYQLNQFLLIRSGSSYEMFGSERSCKVLTDA